MSIWDSGRGICLQLSCLCWSYPPRFTSATEHIDCGARSLLHDRNRAFVMHWPSFISCCRYRFLFWFYRFSGITRDCFTSLSVNNRFLPSSCSATESLKEPSCVTCGHFRLFHWNTQFIDTRKDRNLPFASVSSDPFKSLDYSVCFWFIFRPQL